MSEHYYRVGVHGPPNPDEHPWVMLETTPGVWESVRPAEVRWVDKDVWVPWAPPSELAPEPEDQGVEVDGRRYLLDDDGDLEVYYLSSVGWVLAEYWHGIDSNELAHMGRVAQAFGLVDQPPVPRALVDTVRRWADEQKALIETRATTRDQFHNGAGAAYRRVLSCLELGEFGPVGPSVEWVTDRLPNDDEYPVLWTDAGDPDALLAASEWRDAKMDADDLGDGWRWVSLSVLLDAAGLGER